MISMKYVKQPNNLYTIFDDEQDAILSMNNTVDDIMNAAMNRAKWEVANSTLNIMKAASSFSSFYKIAHSDLYLKKVGYDGTPEEFAKSIERGPVAVTEIDTVRKERWGRCPNCGMSLWHKERGDYNEFHYKCGCGQLISWNDIQWQTQNEDYLRCDPKMPGALQVVLQQTSDLFKPETMIRFSDIVKSIPDITIGEYVVSKEKYDSSWCSDKYRRCDGRMMNALLVVLDSVPENEFKETTMIRIKDVQPFIEDIKIGEYVILKDWFDEGFDPGLEDTYIRCPSDMGGALQVVEDSKSDDEFLQSSMIRINRIARFIPDITVGEYVIILEDYDVDYYEVDKFVKCSGNMPLCITIVEDTAVISDYKKEMPYSIAIKFISDIVVGESMVDENYYDPKWNQYDTTTKIYLKWVNPDPSIERDTRIVVEDATPNSKFDRNKMMKLSSAILLLPRANVKVGDTIVIEDA